MMNNATEAAALPMGGLGSWSGRVPASLHDLLEDLYRRQAARDPNNAYLREQGSRLPASSTVSARFSGIAPSSLLRKRFSIGVASTRRTVVCCAPPSATKSICTVATSSNLLSIPSSTSSPVPPTRGWTTRLSYLTQPIYSTW